MLLIALVIQDWVDERRREHSLLRPRYSDKLHLLWFIPAMFGLVLPDGRILFKFSIAWLPITIWLVSWMLAALICKDYRHTWSKWRIFIIHFCALIILAFLAAMAVTGYHFIASSDSQNLLYIKGV